MIRGVSAHRVEVQRQARRIDDLPERVPVRIPQRLDVGRVRDVEPGQPPALGHALDLGDGGLERMVRDRREAREALGMRRAEPGEPLVVDAGDLDRGLAVGEPSRHAEDPVEHLGLHAVAVLVQDPQLGLGEAADSFLAVVVEPGGGHPVRAIDASGHVLAPADPMPQARPRLAPFAVVQNGPFGPSAT